MLRRVIKNKKKFTLRNSKGYTLVELIVVMGIIGLLLAITFGGYINTRKEKYVQHVANLTQTSIRDAFIDTISTKVGTSGVCNGKSPRISALRVQLGATTSSPTNPISRISVCEGNTSGTLDSNVVLEDIEPSQGLNYKTPVKVQCWKDDGTFFNQSCSLTSQGYLYFIFTSPYGKFYSYYTPSGTSAQANNDFYKLGDSVVGWEQDPNTLMYKPKNPNATGLNHYFGANPSNVIVTFDSETAILQWANRHFLKVSSNGNVKLD